MTALDPSVKAGPRLRVPVTVRVSPDATGQLNGAAARAGVAAAVSAACAQFPLSALGIRPDDITRVDVGVRSSGLGVEVPQALLEAAAAGATEGAARAGFRSSPRSPGRPRVGEPAAEPFDPSRVRRHEDGDTYVMPFFDHGTTEVPLREPQQPTSAPWIPSAGVAVTVEEAVGIAWRWHLYRVGRKDFTQELPGYYGFIRTTRGSFLCFLFLTRVDQVGPAGSPLPGRYTHHIQLDSGGFNGLSFALRGSTWSSFAVPTHGSSEPGDFWYAGGDRVPIVFAIQDPLPVAPGKPGTQPLGYIALPGETQPPDPKEFTEPTELVSALDIIEPPQSETGTQRYIPGDPYAVKKPLVCAPYLVEPNVTELVDTRNLSGRIRSLASVLGIPECGYAGTFALHCAQVVGAHARGVAAASIYSASTTDVTVHPDGSGNNGYVHVKAAVTPELIWLKRLAGIAREVGEFADDVVSTYLDPHNAALVKIHPDDPANAAGWAVRYVNDLNEALKVGYESVFAETCRAIMLQQLRSSHAGITARQEKKNFDALLLDIGTKLEILGDVVLWPTVLLGALEHSRKVYMTTGTVREILSAQETVSYGEGDSYDLPAPIDSTPQRVLAIVGDDRVEKRDGERVVLHEGRSWNAEQLRETINQRRQLLNLSDPIFFQVSDLQSIVFGREQDRGYLERYLKNLFDEMLSANRRMTQDASDLDDGAYFALEASQYVKREGGRDWRGLRYSLQGIHQLADDQLVSEVHGDYLYTAGVNRAIDHKADKDTMIQIASTVGIVVLGLLCAPLGAVAAGAITAVAGIGFTIHDVLDAKRQTDLYKALEDPELFQHWQDVQLAQMMAAVSVAFSIFDVIAVGKGAKALTTAAFESLRIAEKAGAKTVFRLAAQTVREQVLKELTEEGIKRAVKQAVIEATVMAVMNELLPHVIEPVLVPWIREQAQMHGTQAEVDAALGPLALGGPR